MPYLMRRAKIRSHSARLARCSESRDVNSRDEEISRLRRSPCGSFRGHLFQHSDVVLASPPLPDDLSLIVRIEDATDPELRPGARAIVMFDVRQFGPMNTWGFVIQNPPDLIPSGPLQPLRLSELPGSNCYFGEYEDTSATPPGWYYFFTQNTPPIGSVMTCRVGMEVLEPARGGYQVSFYVESLDFENWYDPEPRNNSVVLRVGGGQAIDAVPVRGKLLLLTLSSCLIAAGLRTLGMGGTDISSE